MSKVSAPTQRLRCAIYTRKSSEEGLDQSFNSLHAQREACEAYVLSQAGEGWSALPALYDDGGFSGGNMERPALKRLLADITAGRIDTVVVYKIDRLTRSLADFAKIVEVFDAKGVSFVSVTQAFNTTTSMGRLTLNMLLSFAQFEREVTGERIRDKIAASKARGMWMGGLPPLGYDAPADLTTRALVVNEAEAETVRMIFRLYLELGSAQRVEARLDAENVRSKAWITRSGKAMGGLPFSRGALLHLLKSRTYRGEIVHRGQSYPGVHPAIVEDELYSKVQSHLAAHARRRRERPTKVSTMPLKGLIFDADGSPMIPTFTHRARGQVYRYYVSAPCHQGYRRARQDEALRRVPASVIEPLVRDLLLRLSSKNDPIVGELVSRVDVHAERVEVVLRRSALFQRPSDRESELRSLKARLHSGEEMGGVDEDQALVRLMIPHRLKRDHGRVRLTDASGVPITPTRSDAAMVTALTAAHAALAQSAQGHIGAPERAALDVAPSNSYLRDLMRMAFLAPDLQARILQGRHPPGLSRERLKIERIPLAWADQRAFFERPV